ncbi:MAG TPA: hypothetical protein VM779_16670 [Thermoanaerobaculia bacterium]|nr:hypothetical protein [Thermoanaerobaculia bacterium]
MDMFFRPKVTVGNPSASDAQGSLLWRRFTSGEALYDVWGPRADSPWAPFHCVPLFAALDRIDAASVGPPTPPVSNGKTPQVVIPKHATPGADAPLWIAADALTILDLPGTWSVQAAAWILSAYPCQPVCTFNNWPHRKALLQPERILAELLHWATTVAEARRELARDAPPLWICDSERLGSRQGRPGEFDNRYFLEDAILPGAALLKGAGLVRVVYVTLDPREAPVIDLEGYFADLESAGIPVRIVDLLDPALQPREWIPRPLRTFASGGFKRSSAGGFGTQIPQPSSGG